jgi:hypothetical protein
MIINILRLKCFLQKKPQTPPETPPDSSSSDSEFEDVHRGTDNSASLGDKKQAQDDKPVYNYVHYDPEIHWCRVCDVFPRTAKEFLNHLHSAAHKEQTLVSLIIFYVQLLFNIRSFHLIVEL